MVCSSALLTALPCCTPRCVVWYFVGQLLSTPHTTVHLASSLLTTPHHTTPHLTTPHLTIRQLHRTHRTRRTTVLCTNASLLLTESVAQASSLLYCTPLCLYSVVHPPHFTQPHLHHSTEPHTTPHHTHQLQHRQGAAG